MDTIITGSAITNGDKPLERLWSLRLPWDKLDRELNRMLLREAKRYRLPGFRKNAKIVPPSFRRQNEQRFTNTLVHQMAEPSLQAKLRESGLNVLPSIAVKEHNRKGDEIEVTYQFEVSPEVPKPRFSDESKLLRPQPQIEEANLTEIIERMRRQRAKWNEVDRAAQMGDRVRFSLVSGDSKPQFVELADNLPEDVLKTLVGVAVGDEVELDLTRAGDESPAFKVNILAVSEPEVPELDLDFVRTVTPEVGSVEAFKEQIKEQVDSQGQRLARMVQTQRVLHLLDTSTEDFDLPEHLIELEAANRRNAVMEQAQQQGQQISPEAIDMEVVRKVVTGEIRRGLILQTYIKANEIEVSDDEFGAFVEKEAKDQVNPQEFTEQAASDQQLRETIRREVMQGKVNESVCATVSVEDDKMSLEQLNQAQQGNDPAIVPRQASKEAQAEEVEQENG